MTKIFLDGKYCLKSPRELDLLAPGVLKGTGVFETMRVLKGRILFFEEHFQRMIRGLKYCNLGSPYPPRRFLKIIARLKKENNLDDAGARIAVWREGASLRVAVIVRPAPIVTERQFRKGFSAGTAPGIRNRLATSHIKSIQYGLFRQAHNWAIQHGYDEAILLNGNGQVVEGSRSNVFVVKKGAVLTPRVSDGCLNGIVRQFVLAEARRMGIFRRPVSIAGNMLKGADEIFVTNSLLGVMPVVSINGVSVKEGRPGPVTKEINRRYLKAVGI